MLSSCLNRNIIKFNILNKIFTLIEQLMKKYIHLKKKDDNILLKRNIDVPTYIYY